MNSCSCNVLKKQLADQQKWKMYSYPISANVDQSYSIVVQENMHGSVGEQFYKFAKYNDGEEEEDFQCTAASL